MEVAEALRGLIVLLRAGESARRALGLWPATVPVSLKDRVLTAARLARLGARPAEAVGAARGLLGAHTESVALAFEVHRVSGADLSALLERVAAAAEDDWDRVGGVRAHAAGARLSARMIALLPLATLPLVGFSSDSLSGIWSYASIACGLVLALVGLRWISRLSPEPSDDAGTAWFVADLVAAALRAGMHLPAAMDLLVEQTGAPDALRVARRRVLCGLTWGVALGSSSDEQLRCLGETIRRAERLGAPVADHIEARAERARLERRLRSEEEMRVVPVKMAVPLVLCVLPSFILLGLGPHLPASLG